MKLFKQLFSQRNLQLALLVWVIAGCLIPNIWLSLTERMSVIQSLTNIFLPAGLYILLMSITPKIGKASLWMTILFFFAAFQIVLLYMYGRSVIAVDMFLNLVTTNPGEVGELLGNMMIIIFTVIIIYIPPITLGIIAVKKHWRLTRKSLKLIRLIGLGTLISGIIMFALSYTSSRPYRPHCDIYPLNVAYNLYLAVQRTIKVANYSKTSATFSHHATPQHPDSIAEVYVVVVGETSRADNWQLSGYSRPTSPRLVDKKGLTYFGRTISQSNTTHKSVPMLLSHLDASNFGDSIYYVKSMISAFKDAGFHTSFFSAQSRNHSFIDYFGEEADTCIFIKEDGAKRPHYYDGDLIPYLEKQLEAGHKKQLIVLHAYGSHFNYIDRYPAEQAVFTPDRPAHATHHFRDKQLNAYDNTILYTSNFIADIIDHLDKRPDVQTALIFTSDHGEDIFDDDRLLFLHASPIPSYFQIHVPFIVWYSDKYRTNNPEKPLATQANSDKFVASSKSFFHTIMDIAGISTPYFEPEASVANPSYKTEPAIYLNDHNESVALRNCGIIDNDFSRLSNLDIPY